MRKFLNKDTSNLSSIGFSKTDYVSGVFHSLSISDGHSTVNFTFDDMTTSLFNEGLEALNTLIDSLNSLKHSYLKNSNKD